MKPLVCAVLVNYNGIEDTAECVQSLLTCGYENLRIVIVDNASEHGKAEYNGVIRPDRCEIIFASDNLGFAGANNLGMKRSLELGAEYILVLNNDTVVKNGFLQPLIAAFEHNESLGIATGKIYYYDDPECLWFGGSYYDTNLMECKIDGIGEKDSPKYCTEKDIPFATGCLWLLPVRTVETVGLMSEDYFLYYEDADYCERVREKGLSIRYVPQSVICHKESRSTRKGSDSYKYYNLRNYLIFIQRHRTAKEARRLFTRRFFKMSKDVLRHRLSIGIAMAVWKDVIGERYGKKDFGGKEKKHQ